MDEAITNYEDETALEAIADRVNAMMGEKPLFNS
jgi:hypothetical protein